MTHLDRNDIEFLGTSNIEFLDGPGNVHLDPLVIDESNAAPDVRADIKDEERDHSIDSSAWLVPAATIFMLVFVLVCLVVVISSPLGESILGSPEQDEIRAFYRANGIEVEINRLGWVTRESGSRVKEYRVGLYEADLREGKRVYLGENYWYFDKYGDRVKIETNDQSPLEKSLKKLLDGDQETPLS